MSRILSHPLIGTVKVVEHPASKRISARWKDGYVKLTVPNYASWGSINEALDRMAPEILKRKPEAMKTGDLVLPDWRVTLSRQSLQPDKVTISFQEQEFKLMIGSAIDITTEAWSASYNRMIHILGKKMAPKLLLPRARYLAQSLECKPSGWKISYGQQVLGHCSPMGEIALSYVNVFLPPPLRDYIICHELAHLTHMNHSEKFHRLCDRYLEGREKQLIMELRNYQWPVIRK